MADDPQPTSAPSPAGATGLDTFLRDQRALAEVPVGEALPPHSGQCAGCGPDNTSGLAMQVYRSDDGVRAIHRFDGRQQGAPGIVHGGLVATAFDDLFGFLLYGLGQLAVTRSLTVEYLQPVRLHQDYTLHARLHEQQGRRLELHAQAVAADGATHATAHAVFVAVTSDHFTQGNQA